MDKSKMVTANDNDSINSFTNSDIWHTILFYSQTFIEKLSYKKIEFVLLFFSCTDGFDIDKSNGCNSVWSIYIYIYPFEKWNLFDENSFEHQRE